MPRPLVPMAFCLLIVGPLHGENDVLGKLLVGCYRYTPGDGTGIWRTTASEHSIGERNLDEQGEIIRVMGGSWPLWSPDRVRFAAFTNDVLWLGDMAGNRRGESIGMPVPAGKGSFCWSADGDYVILTCLDFFNGNYSPCGIRCVVGGGSRQ